MTDDGDPRPGLGDLLNPVRAAELKRQRQAALVAALHGPREPDPDDAALDVLADRIAQRIVDRLAGPT
jgi:hypothetical protein